LAVCPPAPPGYRGPGTGPYPAGVAVCPPCTAPPGHGQHPHGHPQSGHHSHGHSHAGQPGAPGCPPECHQKHHKKH
ncbi:hypothetical protein N310_07972, partial [Acanthisitta chloris]